MKQPFLFFAVIAMLFLLPNCTQLEDFEIYPEIIDGNWELVEVTLSNADPDSCDLDDIVIFSPDGSYERQLGTCRPDDIREDITGSWTFREDGDILLVKERIILESGRALTARRFQYDLANDSLRLTEEFEGGSNFYLYVRE